VENGPGQGRGPWNEADKIQRPKSNWNWAERAVICPAMNARTTEERLAHLEQALATLSQQKTPAPPTTFADAAMMLAIVMGLVGFVWVVFQPLINHSKMH